MYLLFLIFFTCGNFVNAGDSSSDEGKFIDLLPEEEKEAFLETVARRLITGVKTKDSRYKSSEEVSDEELNQHSEYVRKVLKEESGNLRRHTKDKTPDDSLKVQGIDKKNKPIVVEDDEDKNHIDLTLRQGIRRKRNEKEEFIPVQTVYDDPDKSDLNTTSNRDDYTKSKERKDENSAAEDIQVRGHRPHSRGSRQAITEDPNLDYSDKRTEIVDFEPSNEYVITPSDSDEKVTTDDIDTKEPETTTVEGAVISSETTDDVKSGHDGFTQSIYESIEAANDRETNSSNESVESVTNSTSTEPIVEITTTEESLVDNVTMTTENIVIESSTIKDIPQNTSEVKKYLRVNNDNGDQEDILSLNETENIDSSSVTADTQYDSTTPTNEVVEDTTTKEEEPDNVNNEEKLSIENKSIASNETDQTKVINTASNEDNFHKVNSSAENDETRDSATTPVSIKDDIEGYSMKGHSANKDKETHSQSNKTNDKKEILREYNETDTELLIDNKPVTKESNSFNSSNYSILRSHVENKESENNSTNQKPTYFDKQVKIDLYQNRHENASKINLENKNRDNVLTTTEKSYENNVATPNYQAYYAQGSGNYLAKSNNKQINKTKTNKLAARSSNGDNDKDIKLEYETQDANLARIAKSLRQGLANTDGEDLEERKPKLLNPSAKTKEYLVYEIPADADDPFVQTGPEPKEQPYYVPVYNYSPNNAYYNAYNRLGPNEDDNDEAEILENVDESDDSSDDDFREPDGHRKFKFNNKKNQIRAIPKANNYKLPLVFKRPQFTEIFFNPDEYLDMDYYFGRSNIDREFRSRGKRKKHKKEMTKSEEELNPYHTMLKGAKTHLDAVRKILYKKRLFGFVPDVTSPKPKKSKKGTTTPKDGNHNHNHNHDHDNNDDYDNNDDHNHDDRYGNDHSHDVRTFRADNTSDYIILYPSTHLRNDHPDQQDISVDYYFGLYNTGDSSGSKTYRDILRESKNTEESIESAEAEKTRERVRAFKEVNKQNNTALSDLIGEIKRRGWKQAFRMTSKKKRQKELEEKKKKWKKNAGTIKEILNMGDINEAFPNLDKLRKLNLTLMRRKENKEEVDVYVNVLRDMIRMGNKALEKYDWLGSTVDILGALNKLKYLTESQENREYIHAADKELLNYVQYLYKISKSTLEEAALRILTSNDSSNYTQKNKEKKLLLPRNKKRKKEYLSKMLLNRVWLYRDRNITQSEKKVKELDFLTFLDDVNNNLYDLHKALKYTAMVTNYKHQMWFANLKSLYLKKLTQKELLELLLHIFTSRLLALIEESAVDGLEDGYLHYVEKKEKEVEKSKEVFVFVLNLLKEIKDSKN